jgi:hypothetical protein
VHFRWRVSNDQKCFFILSLKAHLRPLSIGVARVVGGGAICR